MSKIQNPIMRIAQDIYSKPHLISTQAFSTIEKYIELRNKGSLMKLEDDLEPNEPDDLDDFDPMSGVGIINIEGALTYKPLMTMCGAIGYSYCQLIEDVEDMIEAGATTIVLNVDSGGGQAYGCFETANQIRKMCDDGGVSLICYVDGSCCSAMYALGVVCDEVVANPDAEVGSIGVLISLLNNSEQLKQEGITRSFIYAGDEKVPMEDDGKWKDSFLNSLQENVDALYTQFVSHVSTYSGLSEKAIMDTQAKVYRAEDAMSIGLVNKVMTRADFVNYLATKQKEGAV